MLAAAGGLDFRALCGRFGISVKTGCKWRSRFAAQGAAGLADRSRRPHGSPSRTPAAVEAAVMALRAAHPAWGGRKIAHVLAREAGAAPSPSTVTAVLRRNGVELGAFGGGAPPFTRFERGAPNDLWQMDFKGHAPMLCGRLHPLNVIDDHSRFSVVLAACADERTGTVMACLTAAFRRYGLPLCIMSDNGPPWGDGPGSPFTKLGVALIDQGIAIGHSRPYHPQTNGKAERFHRSLKAEAMSGPPFADLACAQRALAAWRDTYNTRRPHEGIGMAVPAQRYSPSPRAYTEKVGPFDYAPGDAVLKVQQSGAFRHAGGLARVSKAFKGKWIALRPTDRDGVHQAYYRHQKIADIDNRLKTGEA